MTDAALLAKRLALMDLRVVQDVVVNHLDDLLGFVKAIRSRVNRE